MSRRLLTSDELQAALDSLPAWRRQAGTLERRVVFASFPALIAGVCRIGELAESASHHPDMDIRYTTLRVVLSTHDRGGVTALDVELARAIDPVLAAFGVMPA